MIKQRVQEILSIMERMNDNDTACFNPVTHVIFDDNNLGSALIESALGEDCANWRQFINDRLKELGASYDVSLFLIDVGKTIEALYKLREYSDEELAEAQEILNG
jgi:hypothetical protein